MLSKTCQTAPFSVTYRNSPCISSEALCHQSSEQGNGSQNNFKQCFKKCVWTQSSVNIAILVFSTTLQSVAFIFFFNREIIPGPGQSVRCRPQVRFLIHGRLAHQLQMDTLVWHGSPHMCYPSNVLLQLLNPIRRVDHRLNHNDRLF